MLFSAIVEFFSSNAYSFNYVKNGAKRKVQTFPFASTGSLREKPA